MGNAAPVKPLQGLQKRAAEAKGASQATAKKALPSGVPLPGDIPLWMPSLARHLPSRGDVCISPDPLAARS